MRLSLVQSGTEVSGTGEADGAAGCMLARFDVTGTVTRQSFNLRLTNSASTARPVYASGVVAGGELDVTLSSTRTGCQDWNGGSSLNRQR